MTISIKKNGGEEVVLKIINSFQKGGEKITTVDKGDSLCVKNSDEDFVKAVEKTMEEMNWKNNY